MAKSKPTLDKKEDLADLLKHEGMPVLFEGIDELVREAEARVIKYELARGTQHELMALKSQAEGARLLLQAIQRKFGR